MNLDILKRAGQLIVVNTDLFSGYTTACFTESEKIDDLLTAIIQVITPIRHSNIILVRVDQQASLKSISKNGNDTRDSNGINLIPGDDFNKNSNCCVDKRIQELEKELKVISPAGDKISLDQLAKTVTSLNDQKRNQDLSAAEIHVGRDTIRGVNLRFDDKTLQSDKTEKRQANHPCSIKSKAPKGKSPPQYQVSVGDTVFIKDQGTKHKTRSPFIVTGTSGDKISMQKMLNTQPERSGPLTISSEEKQVDKKFIFRLTKDKKVKELPREDYNDYEENSESDEYSDNDYDDLQHD